MRKDEYIKMLKYFRQWENARCQSAKNHYPNQIGMGDRFQKHVDLIDELIEFLEKNYD